MLSLSRSPSSRCVCAIFSFQKVRNYKFWLCCYTLIWYAASAYSWIWNLSVCCVCIFAGFQKDKREEDEKDEKEKEKWNAATAWNSICTGKSFFCTIIQLSWSILERARERKNEARDMHRTNANKLLSVAFVVGDFRLVFSFVFLFHQFFGIPWNRLTHNMRIFICSISFLLSQTIYTLNAQFSFF